MPFHTKMKYNKLFGIVFQLYRTDVFTPHKLWSLDHGKCTDPGSWNTYWDSAMICGKIHNSVRFTNQKS